MLVRNLLLAPDSLGWQLFGQAVESWDCVCWFGREPAFLEVEHQGDLGGNEAVALRPGRWWQCFQRLRSWPCSGSYVLSALIAKALAQGDVLRQPVAWRTRLPWKSYRAWGAVLFSADADESSDPLFLKKY